MNILSTVIEGAIKGFEAALLVDFELKVHILGPDCSHITFK